MRNHLVSKTSFILIMILFCSALFVGAESPGEGIPDRTTSVELYIDVAEPGYHNPVVPDTLVVGQPYQMRIFLENWIRLGCMFNSFRIWSDNGVLWKYVAQDKGWGSNYASITVVPNCRMDPLEDIWDAPKGFGVGDWTMDMVGEDTIMMMGFAITAGLPEGYLEHMLSWHFRILGPTGNGQVAELCFDTASWGMGGAFVFCDMGGINIDEVITNAPYCIPVKALCGNVNNDLAIDIGDAITMLNSIFKQGPPLDPLALSDVNCDGMLNVGDAVYLMNYIFKFGPDLCCM